MMRDYKDFLASKEAAALAYGKEVEPAALHPMLFGWQKDLVRWAVRKGRAALFADCGLGKTAMQLEWAKQLDVPTLILTPLAVATQTVREGVKFGIPVQYVRRQEDVTAKIVVTNYEMLAKFNPTHFEAIILDESSILKSFEGKTRTKLIEAFRETPYRLCCTATPAPNDHAEFGNHAEFLGVMTRTEMLASFFVHDDAGWRLKGHAHEAFYRWLASWAMSLRTPSDLGYPNDGFALPPLEILPIICPTDYHPPDQLFYTGLKGISDRAQVRKVTLHDRIFRTVQLVNRDKEHQWILWCGLNAEGWSLFRLIEGATLIEGRMPESTKEEKVDLFLSGQARVLVTKPSITGFGLNLQNCAHMAFVGLSDSYEQYYQAIRRCWRFGQNEPVKAYVVLADVEEPIYHNVLRKEEEAKIVGDELIANVTEFEKAEIGQVRSQDTYVQDTATGNGWTLNLGDSTEWLPEIEPNSIALSIFSPPFLSLYTYSASSRDLGNSRTSEQFWTHLRFIIDELLTVTMPGRNACVHVAQVPALLVKDGYIGLKDFRGQTILAFEAGGWIYHGEVCIDKDPQAQAIRTHSKALLFAQLKKDASWLRPALADYILIFRKPGDNPIPIVPHLSNDEWIEWARPIWYGIRESDTLQAAAATSPQDERHICPLQLGTIERCVKLWSNPGELILDPFAGIGSTGFEALRARRRFLGIELKCTYWEVAQKNLRTAEQLVGAGDLFAFSGVSVDGRTEPEGKDR